MASAKWTVPKRLEDIIELIEQQTDGGELIEFGVKEHRYVLRKMFVGFCEARKLPVTTVVLGKDGKPELENGKPKVVTAEQLCYVLTPEGEKDLAKFMGEQSNFVCYASNAKKLLIEAGVLDAKKVSGVADYE